MSITTSIVIARHDGAIHCFQSILEPPVKPEDDKYRPCEEIPDIVSAKVSGNIK